MVKIEGDNMEKNQLQEQIEATRKDIKTDTYPMSIGELANLYRDGDLNISPIYQRLFRWDIAQQSALIESILLGIPVPPIYVYQDNTGRWSLIDGLQRLSTIFKFMGILKGGHHEDSNSEKDNTTIPEALVGTKFLRALNGKFWDSENKENSLDEAQRRLIKRSKLPIIIIDQSSDDFAQYEMFQRLNTGGSYLSPQEIRNCILTRKNENIYQFFRELSEDESFTEALPISDREIHSQRYMEFVVKYFVLKYSSLNLNDSDNYHEMLTDQILSIIQFDKLSVEVDRNEFKMLFALLIECFGENAFKRFKDKRFKGGVLVGAFEAIIPGLIENLNFYKKNVNCLEKRVKAIYTQTDFISANKRGTRPVARMRQLAAFSRRFFNPNANGNTGGSV